MWVLWCNIFFSYQRLINQAKLFNCTEVQTLMSHPEWLHATAAEFTYIASTLELLDTYHRRSLLLPHRHNSKISFVNVATFWTGSTLLLMWPSSQWIFRQLLNISRKQVLPCWWFLLIWLTCQIAYMTDSQVNLIWSFKAERAMFRLEICFPVKISQEYY